MNDTRAEQGQCLRAVLVCPDGALANNFLAASEPFPELSVTLTLSDYPAAEDLAERLRQSQSDAILVDVGTNRETALTLIAGIVDSWSHLSIVGLNHSNDPEAILQCLRSGGNEFLSSPFTQADLSQTIQRMLRRKSVEVRPESANHGRILAFMPVKGGSGATTIACNIAHQIHRVGKRRVLLADLNVTAGVISFLFRISHPYSTMDAIKHSSQLDPSLWASLVAERNGMDILLAPERPEPALVEPDPVQQVLEYARSVYDYVIADLGGVCEPVSMSTMSMATTIHLICGSDLPSLFMMRRTIPLTEELGFGREQIRLLVNRVERRSELSVSDMEKIFRAPVHSTFPEDEAAVSRALRDGVPVADNTDLGKAFERFVKGLLGVDAGAAPRSSGVRALKELLSGT